MVNNFSYTTDETEFEKLAMMINNDLAICIANCPDDYSKCSLVMKKSHPFGSPLEGKRYDFVRHELDKEQVDLIIEALQKVRKDMDQPPEQP